MQAITIYLGFEIHHYIRTWSFGPIGRSTNFCIDQNTLPSPLSSLTDDRDPHVIHA